MTADVVNLRQRRKAKARADREQVAVENRAKFGQSKAKRELNRAENALEARKLAGHKTETDDSRDA